MGEDDLEKVWFRTIAGMERCDEVNEHRTDHVPIGKIMAFSNAVLLWCMWYSSLELDSHFIGIVSESPFNEFGGIIATYRSYFCVMNIFRMFLKYFEEFESFVPRM